jgi:hypothetical protein
MWSPIPTSGMSTETPIVPASREITSAGPSEASTSSICWLSASSRAVNRRTPSARARSAIRLQSAVPSPRPCQSSITVIAASALAGSPSLRTKRPTPTPSPVCESNAIRASWS